MTLELLAGALVALAALALVLEPLVRGSPLPAAAASDDELDLAGPEESDSPKIRALLALKEIEFDRAMGKLSSDDYETMKATYERAALAAIEAEEAEAAAVEAVAGDEAEAAVRRAREGCVCPVCGPRPESSGLYCSNCGRRLVAPGVSPQCPACGEPAPSGARFCGECGARLGR